MPEVLQRVSEGKRRKTLTNVQWREFVEQETHRGRLWKIMGKEYVREMCEYSPRKRQSEHVSRTGQRRKAGRDTRPVAVGIASQRILRASKTP